MVLVKGDSYGQGKGEMSVEILSKGEIAKLRVAGRAAAETLERVERRLKAGVTTGEIDRWVRELTKRQGGRPSQLGYRGFPGAVCTSVNEVVCHGVPSERVVLREGDIVNIDVTTELGGFHGDTSKTFVIGKAVEERERVVRVARECLLGGIAVVREGVRLGDLGAVIDEIARREGCALVTEYGGHGIGRKMHMEPEVLHVGVRGRGLRLRAGMAFTIEPMVTLREVELRVLNDGWTVVTVDGSPSAQFEHTVVVTEGGCEVMTEYEKV